MADTPTPIDSSPADTPATLELGDVGAFGTIRGLTSLSGAAPVVDQAIEQAVTAAEPIPVGDHGLAFRLGTSTLQVVDVRQHEDEPRLPSFITAHPKFVGVRSLAGYVVRHIDPITTVAYVHDVYGKGAALLLSDTVAAFIVLDDHPRHGEFVAVGPDVGRRAHAADLVLRPTAAAHRWGKALTAATIGQDEFLDLVVDGITEIAEPDGALLRDLIADLHAIRSTEVRSVMRTGGQGSIELAENVKLHAGPGDEVTFPEWLTIVLQPFAGVADFVTLKVAVKPTVGNDNRVRFGLHCGEIDDRLATVIASVADDITVQTGLPCHWVP